MQGFKTSLLYSEFLVSQDYTKRPWLPEKNKVQVSVGAPRGRRCPIPQELDTGSYKAPTWGLRPGLGPWKA